MKAISLCLWRRPNYTRTVLESLTRCPEIGTYTIFAGIDGGGDAGVIEELNNFTACKVVPAIRSQHVGCNENTRLTLDAAFQESDFVIHLEDDVVVARDALRYMEWGRQFDSDKNLFTLSLWRHDKGWLPTHTDKPKPPDTDYIAENLSRFGVWGWGTWSDRWDEMKRGWTTGGDMEASWDIVLTEKIRNGRCDLSPHCSRAVNIGADLGTHRGEVTVEYWADSPDFVFPSEYKRV